MQTKLSNLVEQVYRNMQQNCSVPITWKSFLKERNLM